MTRFLVAEYAILLAIPYLYAGPYDNASESEIRQTYVFEAGMVRDGDECVSTQDFARREPRLPCQGESVLCCIYKIAMKACDFQLQSNHPLRCHSFSGRE